jgi:hypothetical protein
MATSIDTHGKTDWIVAAFHDAVKKELDVEVEVAVKEAKARLDRRIPEIVAGLSITLMKQIAVEKYGEELRISIKMEK